MHPKKTNLPTSPTKHVLQQRKIPILVGCCPGYKGPTNIQPQPSNREYKNNAGQTQLKQTWNIIIFKKFQKYIDVATMSEVRLAESSSIREEIGYTFNWSEKTSTDRGESGIVFAVRNGLLLSMTDDP